MSTFGITTAGFNIKRLADILTDMSTALSSVNDPVTGQTLITNLADENDPFVQQVQVTADALSLCWEQLQLAYNQFDPLQSSGTALSGLVQLNGLTRLTNETDSQLRSRQQASTTAPARGMIDDCYAALKALSGVTFCRVYQNPLSYTDANGIPAKAVAALVVGGSATDITTALFNHCPVTVFYGNTSIALMDTQGVEYSVNFTRPLAIPIFVAVTAVVINASLWPSDGADQIKQAIVNYATQGASAIGITSGFDQVGISPGESVYSTELAIPAGSVPGVRILAIKVGTTLNPLDAIVALNWNEQASFNVANITVTA